MKTADYGYWDSPITEEMLTTSGPRISDVIYDGDDMYWLEIRPWEEGRSVICTVRDGAVVDVSPTEYSVRSRVHEYGGRCFGVKDGKIVFSNFKDQRLYCIDSENIRAVTTQGTKFAQPVFVNDDTVVAIAEVEQEPEPENFLARVSLTDGSIERLADGCDFYSSPSLSPDCSQLAWISWNHPNMPWDGCELWVADYGSNGLTNRRRIAGGKTETVFQPQWMGKDSLIFAAEPDGWWNLQRWDGGNISCLLRMDAEFGVPLWVFGASTAAITPSGVLSLYCMEGIWHMGIIEDGALRKIDLPFTHMVQLASNGTHAACIAESPSRTAALIEIELSTGDWEIVRSGEDIDVPGHCISVGQPISFETGGGETAHAFYYPPANGDFSATDDALPPLIVNSHGGPTAAVGNGLSLGTQYWTSRGCAVVDVNYRGSTGYGRSYRRSIEGRWGIVDIEDCCAAAEHLVKAKKADPERLAIFGGSAGGYTTLGCLVFRDVFTVGGSYFGVSDLVALAEDTHKFESHYLESLIGPWPEGRKLYEERSPLNYVEKLSCPVIFFQGLDDLIVPPNQARMMADAMKKKGLVVEHIEYAGERHGFLKAETIIDAKTREREFYLRAWESKRSS